MNRMLVVVFKTEEKALEGREALRKLDGEGSITGYAYALIKKSADGVSVVKEEDDPGPLGTLVGTSLGSLIGLLGGPAGLAIGAGLGAYGGLIADLNNVRIGDDFVDEVSRKLAPGTFALLAEIEEEWTAPVDTRMEAIGGEVSRRALSDVRHAANAEEVAAMKADLTQLKAEHAQANADRKAKLHEKINQLDAKIQKLQEKGKARRDAAEARAQAKVAVLRAKAADLRKVGSVR